MSKAPSPLLGYNNNVRHKNRVFHIQTEDSGVKYGHIITHLFMDGGRILKSVKTSYQEYLSNEKLADIIREMMKQQHKAMFIALRDGKFDHLVEGKAERSPKAPPAEPSEPARDAPASGSGTKKKPASGAPKKSLTPTRVADVPQINKDVRADPEAFDEEPKTVRNADPLTLDIDALERAAAADSHAGTFKPSGDLPPPPTNLFREKSATGSYRTVKPSSPPDATNPAHPSRTPPPPSDRRPASSPPRTPPPRASPAAVKRAPSPPPPPPRASPTVRPIPRNPPPPGPASERRYAPTRPASIFGQARPQTGKTIFGEDLISDKSLDEVILSYLADDLEPPPAEKNAKKK
jgi:hypothetical protein